MINTKKLEAYLTNEKTSEQMKSFVTDCVNDVLRSNSGTDVPVQQITFLTDLGLIKKVKENKSQLNS